MRLLAALATIVTLQSTARADDPQALVVPLVGRTSGPLRDAPGRFTRALNELVAETGLIPVAARVERRELEAIAGCSDVSETCLRKITEAMGVTTVVLGELASTAAGIHVDLTVFANGKARRESIVIRARTMERADHAFAERARVILGVPAPTPEPVDEPSSPGQARELRSFRWGQVGAAPYTVAGGGVALLAAGTVLGLLASSKQRTIDDAATDTVDDLRRLAGLEDDGRRLALTSNMAFAAGALATAVGVAWIYTRGHTRRVEVAPMASSAGFGAVATVRAW